MTQELGTFRGIVTAQTPWQPLTVDRVGKDVAMTAETWNSPVHLNQFLRRTSLGSIVTNSGLSLHFTVSDTPYSENHLMLVLSSDEMINRRNWNEGVIIHDCSSEARKIYWLSVVESLRAMQEIAKPADVVMFSENTCCKVTDYTDRLPRSIGLVHGHITLFSGANLKNHNVLITCGGLQEERHYWRNRSDDFIQKLNIEMARMGVDGKPFVRRKTDSPHGYSAKIEGVSGGNFEIAEAIDSLLKTHHEAYKLIIADEVTTKPQPSYRSYVELADDGIFQVSVSPIWVSHAGGINAADIDLTRIQNPDMDMVRRRAEDTKLYLPIIERVKSQLV